MKIPNSAAILVCLLGVALRMPVGCTAVWAVDGGASVPAGAAKARAEVFDLKAVDQAPVASYTARPRFPTQLRREGISGQATVRFVVDTKGNVADARVVDATHPSFGEAAVASVSQWKFRPGKINGRPVNTRMQLPIVFTANRE